MSDFFPIESSMIGSVVHFESETVTLWHKVGCHNFKTNMVFLLYHWSSECLKSLKITQISLWYSVCLSTSGLSEWFFVSLYWNILGHESTFDHLFIFCFQAKSLHVLFEHASGYALFRVKEFEEIGMMLPEVEASVTDLARFNSVVKLLAFSPFKTGTNALDNLNSISEGMPLHLVSAHGNSMILFMPFFLRCVAWGSEGLLRDSFSQTELKREGYSWRLWQ